MREHEDRCQRLHAAVPEWCEECVKLLLPEEGVPLLGIPNDWPYE